VSDLREKWIRVSRRTPCPVCGKPDWCMIASDQSAVICPRVAEGSVKSLGDSGYLHLINGQSLTVSQSFSTYKPVAERKDFGDMAAMLQTKATAGIVLEASVALGVSVHSLRELGVGYSPLMTSLSFPMYDQLGVCGIRYRRTTDGFKFAAEGSRNGVFKRMGRSGPAVVVEGPTDAAAAITMGFATVIGRPFCNGGNQIIRDLVEANQPEYVLIVADGDEAGLAGATKLANELCGNYDVRLIEEPGGDAKDIRAWLRLGATKDDLLEVAANTDPWRKQ